MRGKVEEVGRKRGRESLATKWSAYYVQPFANAMDVWIEVWKRKGLGTSALSGVRAVGPPDSTDGLITSNGRLRLTMWMSRKRRTFLGGGSEGEQPMCADWRKKRGTIVRPPAQNESRNRPENTLEKLAGTNTGLVLGVLGLSHLPFLRANWNNRDATRGILTPNKSTRL